MQTVTAMPQNADRALALLEQAIELERDYAAAHAIIACVTSRDICAPQLPSAAVVTQWEARQAAGRKGDPGSGA